MLRIVGLIFGVIVKKFALGHDPNRLQWSLLQQADGQLDAVDELFDQ